MGKRRIPVKASSDPTDSLHAKPVEEECDLHGLDGRAAEQRLEFVLDRCARTRPGAVVRIITGRGNRSEGTAVLLPLVAGLLDGRLNKYIERSSMDSGGGAFLVQIKG